MNAFCFSPFNHFPSTHQVSRIGVISPSRCNYIRAAPYAKASKSSRNKRPRGGNNNKPSSTKTTTTKTTTGFGIGNTTDKIKLNVSEEEKEAEKRFTYDDDTFGAIDEDEEQEGMGDYLMKKEKAKRKKGDVNTEDLVDLEKKEKLSRLDANGISMEHRLREEILHPLRKPKLTLYGTLAFSATLGFFFAFGRFLTEKDSLFQVSKNLGIDIVAIGLFGYLAWREVQFGRRSLNSIAGIPEARDLPIILKNEKRDDMRLSRLFKNSQAEANDIVIIIGRRNDVMNYLNKYSKSAQETSQDDPALITFVTDDNDTQNNFNISEHVMAIADVQGNSGKGKEDWIAWLADAVPPRRNVALFRIDKDSGAKNSASEYIVVVDDPDSLPMPRDARRLTVVEL